MAPWEIVLKPSSENKKKSIFLTGPVLRYKNGGVFAALTFLCVAVYFHTLFFGITGVDDDVLLTGNLPFLSNIGNIFKVFTTDAFYLVRSIDLYRPIQSATYILDAQWGTNLVFAAHFTNLILHILTCLTVYKLLRQLEFREKIAFLGASVFAVHYLFMCTVAWLPARGDLLLALFTFLALLTFIRIFTVGGWKAYLLHGVVFVLAIFSKESAIILPLLLALYLWSYGRITLKKSHLFLPLFYLAVQVFYFWLKSLSVVLYEGDTGLIPLMKNIRTLPETVVKFFLPLNMSTLPAYKLHATVTGTIIIAVLAVVHLYYRDRFDRRVLFFAGWLFFFILPGMLYYPAFYYFAYEHVDHRAYVTCFGLLLLTLNVVQTFDLDGKRFFAIACLGLLLYLAAFNVYLSGSYRNPTAFARRAIETNPNSALAYAIYGAELYQQERDDEALENLSKSIRIFRKMPDALHTRALIYRKKGMNREALADLNAIVAFDPSYDAAVYTQRAQIKIDLEDFSGAMTDLTSALGLEPDNAEALKALGELRRTVRNNALLPQVKNALQFNSLGVEAGKGGDFKKAEALFRKALVSDPGFYEINCNLGKVLFEQDKKDEACAAWAIAAQHSNVSAREMMAQYCK